MTTTGVDKPHMTTTGVDKPLATGSGRARGYTEWAADQGVPQYSANYQFDLSTVETAPWDAINGSAAILTHDGSNESNDCWLVDIPPGGALTREHHLFEETVYVLSGRGSTVVWGQNGNQHMFEWQPGSLFAIPLNSSHQHLNGSGDQTARLMYVTNAPVVFNLFRSADFVFGSEESFADRFAGESDYFTREGTLSGRILTTNFVADVVTQELIPYPERGGDGSNIQFQLAGNSMGAHISLFAVGRYKKGHKHGPGAHVIVVEGTGYSLMWPEGHAPQRYDWGPGSLIVPPNNWFHQHFNTGNTAARYLALRYIDSQPRTPEGIPYSNIHTRDGGNQIDYIDQDPIVHEMFVEALDKNGVDSSWNPTTG
jgi:uncharacterized RmlC-like cupin family protein